MFLEVVAEAGIEPAIQFRSKDLLIC